MGESDKVGEVDWLGEIYNNVTERFSAGIWVKDSDDEVYSSEDWKDVEAPKAVYESLRPKDPRQYLINCDLEVSLPVINCDRGFLAYNQVLESNRKIVLMDSFEHKEGSSINWSRNIVDITEPMEPTRFSTDVRVSYNEDENDFQDVAETIAENKVGKDMPTVEEVLEYSQRCYSDNPDQIMSELDNLFNQNFLQEQINEQLTY